MGKRFADRYNKDYLSLDNTSCLKGILAICILLHHLYQYTGILSGTAIGYIFQWLGYLTVALFFFLSGYGLCTQEKKYTDYIHSFFNKRVIPYYVIYCLVVILHLITALIIKLPIDRRLLFLSFTFGGTIVTAGWYFQTQLILYFLFYIAYKTKKAYRYVFLSLELIVFSLICFIIKLPITWYESIFAFAFGIIWCEYRHEIDCIIKKHFFLLSLLMSIFFVVTALIGHLQSIPIFIMLPFKMLSTLLYSTIVMMLISRISIVCGLTKIIGKYSLEIYALQGIALVFFRSEVFYINNTLLYILSVIGLTAILSFLIHPIFQFININIKMLINKKG